MEKIIEVKQMDIYQEIARVCPTHNDLKDLPPE